MHLHALTKKLLLKIALKPQMLVGQITTDADRTTELMSEPWF